MGKEERNATKKETARKSRQVKEETAALDSSNHTTLDYRRCYLLFHLHLQSAGQPAKDR
ncbi:hypothetical protein D3C79_1047510 [compost metagenome]